MQASSLLPGNQKSGKWVPEMIMLFWEALQCNRSFRSFIIESNHAYDFVILCIYYATQHRADPSKQGVAKMCIYVLQTISVEPEFGMGLNRAFETQDALPSNIRLSDFRGTYGDFLVRVCSEIFSEAADALTSTSVDSFPHGHKQRENRRSLSRIDRNPQ